MNNLLEQFPRSGLRAITEKAILSGDNDIIFLGYGQPLDAPDINICKSISEAAMNGYTQYTLNAGRLETRQAVVEKFKRSFIEINKDQVIITCGATSAFALVMGCLINPNDVVLVPDPGYPNFTFNAMHYGAKIVYYNLKEENNFDIDLDEIKTLVDQYSPKAIIVNTPGNPTGAIISESSIRSLSKMSMDNNFFIICDEVYDELIYNKTHYSPLSIDNDLVISIFSLSKTYNLCGLRIGYIVTKNKSIIDLLIKSQEYYVSCANSIAQHTAEYTLLNCQEYAKQLRDNFYEKIKAASNILIDYINYKPCGAFYLLVNISHTGLSSTECSFQILDKQKVVTVPGITFGPSSDKYIRISLVESMYNIIDGCTRIKNFLENKNGMD